MIIQDEEETTRFMAQGSTLILNEDDDATILNEFEESPDRFGPLRAKSLDNKEIRSSTPLKSIINLNSPNN